MKHDRLHRTVSLLLLFALLVPLCACNTAKPPESTTAATTEGTTTAAATTAVTTTEATTTQTEIPTDPDELVSYLTKQLRPGMNVAEVRAILEPYCVDFGSALSGVSYPLAMQFRFPDNRLVRLAFRGDPYPFPDHDAIEKRDYGVWFALKYYNDVSDDELAKLYPDLGEDLLREFEEYAKTEKLTVGTIENLLDPVSGEGYTYFIHPDSSRIGVFTPYVQ